MGTLQKASPVHSALPVEGKGLAYFKLRSYHAKHDIHHALMCYLIHSHN